MADELSIQVGKLSPRAGDVLVFRYPASSSEETRMHLWKSAQGCQNYFGCKCITLPESLSLENADEATLNAAGWYRRQGPFNLLDGIRIDEENGKITQLRPGDVAVDDAVQPDVTTTTPPDERNPTP